MLLFINILLMKMILQEHIVPTLQLISLIEFIEQVIQMRRIGLQLDQYLLALGHLVKRRPHLLIGLIQFLDLIDELVFELLENILFVDADPLEEHAFEVGEVDADHVVVVDEGVDDGLAVSLELRQ
jgi:hypothetical protein